MSASSSLLATAARLIRRHSLDRTFYMYDLAAVRASMRSWRSLMPEVRPFYAVKCNPDLRVMAVLRQAGAGFDCASSVEIRAAEGLGVDPAQDVLFAHPCKHPAEIKIAEAIGVCLTTVDNVHELAKLRGSKMDALLRVAVPPRPDGAKAARIELGLKYGADAWTEAPAIVAAAAEAGVRIAGASFHVGSSCVDPSAFERAIGAASHVGVLLGSRLDVLDIGGGFGRQMPLGRVAHVVDAAIETHFTPHTRPARVIAEPGRFFVEAAATVVSQVIGKRVRHDRVDYFIADGLYGSFNCALYDGQVPAVPTPLRAPRWRGGASAPRDGPAGMANVTVWGPTCDSADCVLRDVRMPGDLSVGDWLVFPGMGAYTVAGACDFNGIPMASPPSFYFDERVEARDLHATGRSGSG